MSDATRSIRRSAIFRVRGLLLGAGCVALTAAGLEAQSFPQALTQGLDPRAGVGVQLESYSFGTPEQVDIDKVSLTTVPIAATVSLPQHLQLGVSTAYSSATLTRSAGTSASISGLTDSELRLSYITTDDRVRISAVAVLPTGKSKLTAEEMDVMGVVAADLLPFAISNWGSGGGLGLNAAFATPLNEETSVGVSAGYVVARDYEPLNATSFAYRPGNQLHVRASGDRTFGAAAKATLQLTYLHFGQDQNAGTNFYQSGDRMQAVGSFAFAAGARATGLVYAGYLRRSKGEYTDAVRVTPAQDLVYLGTGFSQQAGGLVLTPTLDLRLLGNDTGVEQGRTISVGLGAELPMGGLELLPLVRARLGHLTVRTGQESGFTGFEVGLSVRNRTFSR